MVPFQAVSRTFGMGTLCLTLVACYPQQLDVGNAETAAELAPSLDALREMAPEYHRRLEDGTFDSLSLLEQWDFVAEIRELEDARWKAERGSFQAEQRQRTLEFLDSIEAMPSEYAEESLAFRRKILLRELKLESDSLRMENWASGFARIPTVKDAPR